MKATDNNQFQVTSFKFQVVICLLYLFLFPPLGGTKGGCQNNSDISDDMLKYFRATFEQDEKNKALMNAVTNNEIKKLALNRKNIYRQDYYFSHQVKTKGITDQKSSGRCWLFAALNVLRPKVMEKYNIDEFEFSQNFSFFFDQLEKANFFLEEIIATAANPLDDRKIEWLLKNAITDGGVWNMFVDITEKYGLAPKSAMPESYNSENTNQMLKLIRMKLREDAMELRAMRHKGESVENCYKRKLAMLAEIYKMLAITLGEPPEEFLWRYKDKNGNLSQPKSYTPKSFYKEVVALNLKDYVQIMNDPSREYYQVYEIEYDRNMSSGNNWRYINLPVEEIKDFAKASIIGNEAMYFSCDVSQQLNSDDGTLDVNNYDYESLFGIKFGMDKKQRIQTYESGSSHGMSLIGVDLDANGKPVKWLLENTWGPSKGHNGYLIMTDEWLTEYMFRIVVHKKFITEKILKILEQPAIKLPPWDPMFSPDE